MKTANHQLEAKRGTKIGCLNVECNCW